ncbi:hypothetical protein DIT68_03490 [Brumimicrobium oceani]|uniref:Uncharacterized protein n=1 Tax=Brumimicrobium oceani TaxID=2100725 RepID=A0A2U2XEU5_9FLAO|nr:hypothetical protein DIT68_03490 [Brumimicrobium oceani]
MVGVCLVLRGKDYAKHCTELAECVSPRGKDSQRFGLGWVKQEFSRKKEELHGGSLRCRDSQRFGLGWVALRSVSGRITQSSAKFSQRFAKFFIGMGWGTQSFAEGCLRKDYAEFN